MDNVSVHNNALSNVGAGLSYSTPLRAAKLQGER
jgi:hypothetical protein